MGKTSNTKTIIAILLVLGVMFYAYSKLFSGGSSSSDEEAASSTTDVGTAGMQVVALLDQLKGIRMDSSIFTSPVFLSLHDETASVAQEPIGRNNPFAPVGTDGAFVPADDDSFTEFSVGGSSPVDTSASSSASVATDSESSTSTGAATSSVSE